MSLEVWHNKQFEIGIKFPEENLKQLFLFLRIPPEDLNKFGFVVNKSEAEPFHSNSPIFIFEITVQHSNAQQEGFKHRQILANI